MGAKTIGIIGMGLIGGSIAKAIKQKSPETIIIAQNRTEEPLQKALKEHVIDHFTKKINETFSACEIIFICVPVSEAAHIAEHLTKYTTKDTIVTDVGSTKSEICALMQKYKENFTFIGGHPMAGSELSGYDASKHYLFENAYYLLTPYRDTPKEKTSELLSIVEKTGALSIIIEPETHDFITGAISHAPHVIAMSLVNAVERACGNAEEAITLASGGFKDITRIASSSPKMWNDISFQNKDNILKFLALFKEVIGNYEEYLLSEDNNGIYSLFENAKAYRDNFSSYRPRSNRNTIHVDLEDRPGGIAFITTLLAYNGINIKNIFISNNRDFESGILEILVESEEDLQKGMNLISSNGFIVK